MNRTHKSITCLMVLSLLTLTSCLQKTTSTRNENNSGSNNQTTPPNYNDRTPPPTNDNNGNDPNTPGIPGGGGQTTPYHETPEIIVKKKVNGVYWSNLNPSHFPSQDRHVFDTDSRFNLRVVPLDIQEAGPNNEVTATDGSRCNFLYANQYKKLSLTVCVRPEESSTCYTTFKFSPTNIDTASKVKNFSIPSSTSYPLVVEVTSVGWDNWCELGYTAYCPTTEINQVDCVKFKLQFSTDNTLDLPGDRY